MDLFWESHTWDIGVQKEVYKIIETCSFAIKEDMKMEFLRRIDSTKGEKQIPEEIEVIYELGKSSWGKEESGRLIADLLWDASVNPVVSNDVSKIAIKKFGELLHKWDFANTQKYFDQVIQNLNDHRSAVQSLRIFRKITDAVDYGRSIERAEDSPEKEAVEKTEEEILSTSDCIEHYIDHANLIDHFFTDMIEYCSFVKDHQDEKIKDPSKHVYRD